MLQSKLQLFLNVLSSKELLMRFLRCNGLHMQDSALDEVAPQDLRRQLILQYLLAE